MKICGGAAFRKELGIERRFRDARAARVMAPTTDALLDFIGRAISGLPLLGTTAVNEPFLLGAVAYDPKVVTIWDGFRRWFDDAGFAFDYVLYSNYERQVDELLAGRIDVAWNSPLAWVRARRMGEAAGTPVARSRCATPTATSRRSWWCAPTRPARSIGDLAGATVGTGAVDSPQSTLLPIDMLRGAGIDVTVRRFEVGVGLHGDHIGGEREAARALVAGDVDAACMIDGNHLLFTQEGTLAAGATRIVGQTANVRPLQHDGCARTPTTKLRRASSPTLLLAMDYADADGATAARPRGPDALAPRPGRGLRPARTCCGRRPVSTTRRGR